MGKRVIEVFSLSISFLLLASLFLFPSFWNFTGHAVSADGSEITAKFNDHSTNTIGKAADGDENTYYMACSNPSSRYNSGFVLYDLKEIKSLNSISVKFHNGFTKNVDYPAAAPSYYNLKVSADNVNWEIISSRNGPNLRASDISLTFEEIKQIRYIRLDHTRINDGTGWCLGIKELSYTTSSEDVAPTICTNGQEKCEGTNSFLCQNNEWVNQGQVNGKCSYTLPAPNISSSGSCFESWTCSEWTSCSAGQRTRTCSDSNNCGTTANKPSIEETCATFPSIPITPPTQTSIACSKDSDCGSLVQEYRCSGTNILKKNFIPKCENPGTTSSFCKNLTGNSLTPCTNNQVCQEVSGSFSCVAKKICGIGLFNFCDETECHQVCGDDCSYVPGSWVPYKMPQCNPPAKSDLILYYSFEGDTRDYSPEKINLEQSSKKGERYLYNGDLLRKNSQTSVYEITSGSYTPGVKGSALNFYNQGYSLEYAPFTYDSTGRRTPFDYWNIPNELTISTWVKLTKSAENSVFVVPHHSFAQKQYSTVEFLIDENNHLNFYAGNLTNLIHAQHPRSLSLNQWHHVVASYSQDGTVILFVDGQQEIFLNSPLSPPLQNKGTGFYIGNGGPEGLNRKTPLNGAIDELKVYSRALPQEELDTLFNSDCKAASLC